MNIITSQRTYKTVENATAALERVIAKAGYSLDTVRYIIATSATDPTRYVPTLVGVQYAPFAHYGIMVIG